MSNKIKLLFLLFSVSFATQPYYGQSGPDIVTCSDIYEGRADVVASACVKLEPGFHAVSGCDVHVFIDADSIPQANDYHPAAGDIIAINATPNYDKNYIVTTTMREATADETLIGQTGRTVEIEYLNGSGNLEMSVLVKGSPRQKDLVDNVARFDVGKRKDRLYLAYESKQENGEYKDAVSEAFHYHSDSLLAGRDGDSRPWRQLFYDGSPLNRPAGETGMGSRWQGHSNRIKYKCNSSVIALWKYNPSDVPVPVSYTPGSLFYEEHTDEDSLRHRVYSDLLGRVVLEETVGRDNSVLRTAYVYNSMGQLRCVVPPMAASPAYVGLCYFFKYDKNGRVCERTIPDHGTERCVFDKKGRLVLKQDDNQYDNYEWTFTFYDSFDRMVMRGCLKTLLDRETLQYLFDTQNIVDEQWSVSGPLYGYYGTSYPATLQIDEEPIETVNWYDSYGYQVLFNQNYSCPVDPSGQSVIYDGRTKGLPTGSMERIYLNGQTVNMLHANYYDSRGQLLCSVGDNHLGGRTTRFFNYNFSGQVTEVATVHYVAGQDSTIVRCRYTFDHTGRKLQEYYRLNDNPEFLSMAYEYNAIGDLLNTYLYSADSGNTFAQKLRYHYNIRGWLTDLNSFEDPGYDLFTLKLAYETPNTTLSDEIRYNGNISQMCSNGRYSKPFGFGFYYDEYDRLFSTNYAEGISLAQSIDDFHEDYDYDENGNMTGLLRAHGGRTIDALWFKYYEGTNKISQIDDASEENLGYPCVSGAYLYDHNGNITYDPSKYIDVTYNRFNLPLTVTSAISERVKFTYSATGSKLRKEYSTLATPGSHITDYCDEFLYEDNKLVCIFTPFGRITPMETANDTSWRICYSLTDHLGNVRAEFVAHSGGSTELVQQTDYYPFGYTMRRNDYASARPNHRLYGGKELQDETVAGHPLGWYDFEARMYDPLIGRFISTDPLAEKYYGLTPYGYCKNNPIVFIDPNGKKIEPFGNEEKEAYMAYRNIVFSDNKYSYIQEELIRLENAEEVFRIRMGENASRNVGGGNFIYNKETDEFDVNITDFGDFNTTGKIAHELKHADQYIKGELGFDIRGDEKFGKPIAYDINDEYEAYTRQSFFDTKTISEDEINQKYKGLNQKKLSIENNTPYNKEQIILLNTHDFKTKGKIRYIYHGWQNDIQN